MYICSCFLCFYVGVCGFLVCLFLCVEPSDLSLKIVLCDKEKVLDFGNIDSALKMMEVSLPPTFLFFFPVNILQLV